jgi:hypothetical protein
LGSVRRIGALVAAAVALAACGPRPADVGGVWVGTWTADNPAAGRGAFRADIQQDGRRLTGRIRLDIDGIPEARVDGGVTGDVVNWGVVRDGLRALTFEGRVRGERAAGTYSVITARAGRWEARRVERPAR